MLARILLGLLIMTVGFHLVWKTETYLSFFGRVPFAERYLSFEGGSRLFYKLLGVALCFLGMLVATNLIQKTIIGMFGSLFSSLQ